MFEVISALVLWEIQLLMHMNEFCNAKNIYLYNDVDHKQSLWNKMSVIYYSLNHVILSLKWFLTPMKCKIQLWL